MTRVTDVEGKSFRAEGKTRPGGKKQHGWGGGGGNSQQPHFPRTQKGREESAEVTGQVVKAVL